IIKSAAKWIEPFIEERMVFGRGFLASSIQYIKIPSGKHPSIRLQMEMPRARQAHVFILEEHTSELHPIMRTSYDIMCLREQVKTTHTITTIVCRLIHNL